MEQDFIRGTKFITYNFEGSEKFLKELTGRW